MVQGIYSYSHWVTISTVDLIASIFNVVSKCTAYSVYMCLLMIPAAGNIGKFVDIRNNMAL